jgi:hypothetical protein
MPYEGLLVPTGVMTGCVNFRDPCEIEVEFNNPLKLPAAGFSCSGGRARHESW